MQKRVSRSRDKSIQYALLNGLKACLKSSDWMKSESEVKKDYISIKNLCPSQMCRLALTFGSKRQLLQTVIWGKNLGKSAMYFMLK